MRGGRSPTKLLDEAATAGVTTWPKIQGWGLLWGGGGAGAVSGQDVLAALCGRFALSGFYPAPLPKFYFYPGAHREEHATAPPSGRDWNGLRMPGTLSGGSPPPTPHPRGSHLLLFNFTFFGGFSGMSNTTSRRLKTLYIPGIGGRSCGVGDPPNGVIMQYMWWEAEISLADGSNEGADLWSMGGRTMVCTLLLHLGNK